MQYITGTTQFKTDRRSVVTLGKFDGMHRGHQKLLHRVLEISREKNLLSVLFTFDVSPLLIKNPKNAGLLLTNEERRNMLENSRLDWLVECPFEKQLMQMEPEVFIRRILVDQLNVRALVVGPDFRFGHERRGDVGMLIRFGQMLGYTVEVLEKETYRGKEISSTRIREAVQKGEMEEAADMLGYPYFFDGEVIYGRQLGRRLGIPTTNLRADVGKVIPPFGVYITRNTIYQRREEGQAASFENEMEFGGITNIGVKPTVLEKFVGIETHLFSCNLNLYGKHEKVELLKYRRPEKKFDSIEELKAQILADEEAGKAFLAGRGVIK